MTRNFDYKAVVDLAIPSSELCQDRRAVSTAHFFVVPWFVVVILLGMVAADRAQAQEVSVEAGQCRYGNIGDGTFQQSDLHTDNYLRPGCGGVAVADKWDGSERFGWRVGFLATGKIRARDNASTQDEHAHRHHRCNQSNGDDCLMRFNGEGRTFGVSTGFTADARLTSHTTLTGESGLFFFQHHFKANVGEPECPGCSQRQIAFNESSKLWDSPSPYVGLTLRYRRVYVSARHYWPSGNRALSLTDFSMTQMVAGVVVAQR